MSRQDISTCFWKTNSRWRGGKWLRNTGNRACEGTPTGGTGERPGSQKGSALWGTRKRLEDAHQQNARGKPGRRSERKARKRKWWEAGHRESNKGNSQEEQPQQIRAGGGSQEKKKKVFQRLYKTFELWGRTYTLAVCDGTFTEKLEMPTKKTK